MKKFLLLITTAVLIVGCDFTSKKPGFVKFSKNTIEFKNNTIVLTSDYAKTSTDEFKQKLDLLDESKLKFKKVALAELKKIEDKKVDYEIFIDVKNVENYVFIYTCDFYKLDEHRAARVVQALSDQRKDEANVQEVKYRRIHGRFFFTPTSKVVKLKYLKAYKKDRKFQTEYIVASKSGGIGLLISNLKDIDFENSVKHLASK
ncbi:hypothetical protein D1816_15335 [Aquimarina sp. AD10]|uniref:Uncharacterized protein n=1 Tax=Aquimarina aggregata TaxID=1642818 RepID=A0A162WE33_9FLAO|nr:MULTISPECIES: hypothetical protein [Aquimarina]AXT61668.1 hypothetical protein D1816_15335 [Aquimarina sp. AD10]KZS38036.1 hypothetical protein AWE51_18495 [Aquimarina aggregata]RKN00983.1 hypothetical protein D7033_06430 [Aquimarina sp. AD10]